MLKYYGPRSGHVAAKAPLEDNHLSNLDHRRISRANVNQAIQFTIARGRDSDGYLSMKSVTVVRKE
jgi:hypothetical protein